MSATMDWISVFTPALDWAVLAGLAFYGTFVLITYLTHGSRPRPQIDFSHPKQLAEDWAVWLGVKAVAVGVRAGRPVVSMLSEASAEVGDWFLSNLHHESR